ncbi:response regulator [Treponema sp. OttesenSCG-928-L16]|nr:response regulator [Treponema sp. OttesenSCG-928-L16]
MKYVLVVDDNQLALDGIIHSISWEELGLEVAGCFYDAQSVLETLPNIKADIVISDIRMPGMSGIEMIEKVAGEYPNIKIILVSAYNDFQYVQDALRIGAFDYIEKPIDYDYLSSILKKALEVLDRDERNLEEIRRSRDVLAQSFFHNLIRCAPETARIRLSDYPLFLKLPEEAGFFISVIVEISNSDEIRRRHGFENTFVFQLGLKNEIEQCFSSFPLVSVLFDYNSLIISLALQGDSRIHAANQTGDMLACLLKDTSYHMLDLNIGIGSVVPEIWQLSESYQDARRALEYRFFFPQKNIFDVRDFSNRKSSQDPWNTALEERLIQLMCRKDTDGIGEYMAKLAALFAAQRDKKSIFVILYSLSGRIVKFLYDIDMNTDGVQDSLLDLYNNLDSFSSSDEVCRYFCTICIDICEKMQKSRDSYQNQLCMQVNDFIGKNYSSPKLSLNEIASFANISASHLSTVFKISTGCTISDAITNARIKEAQLLLSNTNLPIKDICERVGYANQYYFSSCFKKKTGETPSAFRNSAEKSV